MSRARRRPRRSTTRRPPSNRPLKLGLLTCLWQRHALTEIVLGHYAALRESLAPILQLEPLAVGSEGQTTRSIAERHGFRYLEHANQPLGAKWNAGLRAFRQTELDALLIVGSDDLLDRPLLEHFAGLLRDGARFIGLRDMYFFDQPSRRLLHWPGYVGPREGETTGLGRCIHRHYLEATDWHLWDDTLTSGLDRSMMTHLAPHMTGREAHHHILDARAAGFAPIDVKTAVNLWSYDQVAASGQFEHLEADAFLRQHFPAGLVDKLLALKPSDGEAEVDPDSTARAAHPRAHPAKFRPRTSSMTGQTSNDSHLTPFQLVKQRLTSLLLVGEAAFEAGEIDVAERAFESVLEIHPTDARALTNLAVVKHTIGESQAAEHLLLKAIVFGADPTDALLNLGAILNADDRLAEATAIFSHPALGPKRDFDALRETIPTLLERGLPLAAAELKYRIDTGRPPKLDMRRYDDIRLLRLEETQIYPEGTSLDPEFFCHRPAPFITKQTPIASIGSCFAREVKDYLVSRGYNYLQTSDAPPARHGSAGWERVYNTFCLRQEFERALSVFDPAVAAWPAGGTRLWDPYRKGIMWRDEAHRRGELEHHRATARQALTACEVLIVTIGVNEIWYDRDTGDVFSQLPPPDVFDPDRHLFRLGTVAENLANLERMYALIAEHNPGCQMLITVSPVPLRVSFRREHNVVVNSVESKSTLLVAAKAFIARHEDVHYFPSYELVQHVIEDPFEFDRRHVKRSTVSTIMRVFERNFVQS